VLSGLPRFLRHPLRAGRGEAFLWAMTAASAVLLWAPGTVLDHRGEGMQMVMAPLAARNLLRIVMPRFWRSAVFNRLVAGRARGLRRRRRLLSINLVLLASVPTVLYLAVSTAAVGRPERSEVYLTADDVSVLSWMRDNVERKRIVVGGPESDEFVAAYSGAHAAWGNYAWTPEFDREGLLLIDFFKGRIDPRAYLSARHIDYVYFGPREATVASFDPHQLTFLRDVYSSGATTLYRVAPCSPACDTG
jgi:hypothetical protein